MKNILFVKFAGIFASLALAGTLSYAELPLNKPQLIEIPTVEETISQAPKALHIAELAKCESSGRPNIKILDSNGKYSYGLYQFQLDTFYRFGKQYNILPNDLELKEAENLIYDPEIQTKLASRMLQDGLWRNWYNCLHDYYD